MAASCAVALGLAVNPAYLNMVIFDNNAIGAMMAGLGLVCASMAAYLRRRCVGFAFLLGVSVGLAVWARANFVWTLLAGGVAILLVYRRKISMPLSHAAALVAGGIVGGAPFLLFQFVSNGATWKAQGAFVTGMPWRELIPYRLFLLGDSLLSDGEHRKMWGDTLLPNWQLWFFPILVGAACLVCLGMARAKNQRNRPFARVAALSLVLLSRALFSSRLVITEHHFIAALPFAVVVVVLCVLDASIALRIGAVCDRGTRGALLLVGGVLERGIDSRITEYRRDRGLVGWGHWTGAPPGRAIAFE